MVTGSAGRGAVSLQEPLAGLRAAVAAARREAGGILAAFRHTAGFSQAELATRIGYSPTAVAHAERARRPVSAEFWELADEALGAAGKLTARGTRIKDLITAVNEERRRLEKAGHGERLSRLLSQPRAGDAAAAVPAAGRCPHCRRPAAVAAQSAGPPETGTGPAPPLPPSRPPRC